jgi:hypothetical protein
VVPPHAAAVMSTDGEATRTRRIAKSAISKEGSDEILGIF